MKTKEKLAAVLKEAGLNIMAEAAARGHYDDFESELDCPCLELVKDLEAAGRADLAGRAKSGEWDATKEESEAWFQRVGKAALKGLGL